MEFDISHLSSSHIPVSNHTHQQSDIIFTQSLKDSQVSDFWHLQDHAVIMESFKLNSEVIKRDKTLVHIVEDKLFERSMQRYQSFKKSATQK